MLGKEFNRGELLEIFKRMRYKAIIPTKKYNKVIQNLIKYLIVVHGRDRKYTFSINNENKLVF